MSGYKPVAPIKKIGIIIIMNEFDVIKNLIIQNSSVDDEYFQNVDCLLTIKLKGTDLHPVVRGSNVSHKYHIDLTSGASDKTPSPVTYFFEYKDRIKKKFKSQINTKNLTLLGSRIKSKNKWIKDQLTYNPLAPVNQGKNPKAQLFQSNDVLELRKQLKENDNIIITKKYDGIYDLFGIKDNKSVTSILGVKSKKVFLNKNNINKEKEFDYADQIDDELSYDLTEINELAKSKQTRFSQLSKVIKSKIRKYKLQKRDRKEEKAIEQRAMNVAIEHLKSKKFEVYDVSTPELAKKHLNVERPGYDLLAKKNNQNIGVEVKGTKSKGKEVNITFNEINKLNWIFCVSNIKIRKTDYQPIGKCSIYICEFSKLGKNYINNTVNQLEKIVKTNNGISLNKDLKFTVDLTIKQNFINLTKKI